MVGDFISGGATGWVFEHSREPDKVIKIMKAFPRVGTKVLDAFQYDDYLLDRHPMRYNANHLNYDHDWSVSMLWRPMSAKMQTYLFDELMASQRMGMKAPSGIVKVYDSIKMELPLQFTKDTHEEIMTQDMDLADAWDDNFLSVKGPGHRNSYIISMEKLRVPAGFGRSRLRPRVEVFKEVADYLWNNFNLVTRDTASAGNYGFRANKELVIFDPIVSPLPFANEWDAKDIYDRLRYNYFSYLFTEEPFPIDSSVEARGVNRKIKQIEKQLANNTFNTIERDAESFAVEGFPGSELDGTALSDWSVRDIMYSTSVTGNFLEDQAKFNYGLNAESMYHRDSTYELYLRMPNGQEDILSRQNNFNMALAQMCGLILGNKVVYEIGIYGPRLADPYYKKDLLVRYKYGEFTGNDPDAVRLARDNCLEPKGFDSGFQEEFEAPAPKQTKVKFPRAKADKIVSKVEAHLKPMVEKMMACGSYRRGAQMIGDIDFVIIPKEGYTLPQMLPPNEGVNWVGDNKAQVIIDGEKVDFKVTTPAAWGATIMYFTGPADFNIKYRWMAKRKGLKLSEYGLFDRNTDQYLAGATEADIFTALGRPYKDPAQRQGFSKSKKKAEEVEMLLHPYFPPDSQINLLEKFPNAKNFGALLNQNYMVEGFEGVIVLNSLEELLAAKTYDYGRTIYYINFPLTVYRGNYTEGDRNQWTWQRWLEGDKMGTSTNMGIEDTQPTTLNIQEALDFAGRRTFSGHHEVEDFELYAIEIQDYFVRLPRLSQPWRHDNCNPVYRDDPLIIGGKNNLPRNFVSCDNPQHQVDTPVIFILGGAKYEDLQVLWDSDTNYASFDAEDKPVVPRYVYHATPEAFWEQIKEQGSMTPQIGYMTYRAFLPRYKKAHIGQDISPEHYKQWLVKELGGLKIWATGPSKVSVYASMIEPMSFLRDNVVLKIDTEGLDFEYYNYDEFFTQKPIPLSAIEVEWLMDGERSDEEYPDYLLPTLDPSLESLLEDEPELLETRPELFRDEVYERFVAAAEDKSIDYHRDDTGKLNMGVTCYQCQRSGAEKDQRGYAGLKDYGVTRDRDDPEYGAWWLCNDCVRLMEQKWLDIFGRRASFDAEDNYEATYGKEQAKIRRKLKKQIKAKATHGTKAGQWSARKSQLLKQKYEAACERRGLRAYKGKKTSKQQDLSNWSKQKWGTASGKKSSVTGEPYFPAGAVKALKKKGLYAKATRQKRAATKAGKQRASYSKDIQNVVADYRAEDNPLAGFSKEEFFKLYKKLTGDDPTEKAKDFGDEDNNFMSSINNFMIYRNYGPTALGAESQAPVCPICYNYIPNNQNPGAYPGALARYDNQTEICSDCGTTEALVGMMAPPEVLSTWEQSDRSFKDYQQLIMNTKRQIPEIMFGRGPEIEKLRKIQQEMDEKNSEYFTEEMFERRRAVANTRETGYRSDYETPMAINLSYQNYHKPFEGIGSLFGAESKDSKVFGVQRHDAHRAGLHYDLRLERDGMLKSWSIPKGMPTDKRHLAIATPDHAMSWLDFDGDIPEGSYGAGKVSLDNKSTFQTVSYSPKKWVFYVNDGKYQGKYTLVHWQDNKWLISRNRDQSMSAETREFHAWYDLATEKQRNYIKRLGGDPHPDLNRRQASKLINQLAREKKALDQITVVVEEE